MKIQPGFSFFQRFSFSANRRQKQLLSQRLPGQVEVLETRTMLSALDYFSSCFCAPAEENPEEEKDVETVTEEFDQQEDDAGACTFLCDEGGVRELFNRMYERARELPYFDEIEEYCEEHSEEIDRVLEKISEKIDVFCEEYSEEINEFCEEYFPDCDEEEEENEEEQSLEDLGISGQFAMARGYTEVEGDQVLVQAMVYVQEGLDVETVGNNALRELGATPFQSHEYSTLDIHWDQFDDSSNSNDYVLQYYNPANDPTGGNGEAALLASHQTWNDVTTSDFAFQYGGTTTRYPSLVQESPGWQYFDGYNDVAWMNLRSSTTLGVTWTGSSTDEADMALNTDFTWFTDGINDFDVETVFLHENGHAAGIGHSDVAGSIMEAVYAGVRRELHQDDIDAISTLYPAAVIPDTPPTVAITSHSENELVNGTFTIEANAGDDDAVTKVEFFVDGGLIVSDPSSPYSASWDSTLVSDGFHTISAVATDSTGQTTSSSVNVEVDNIVDFAPDVSITSHTENEVVDGSVLFTANASDDFGVSKVEFFINGGLIATDSSSPYSTTWNSNSVSDGFYTLTVVATDTSNQTKSESINFEVDNIDSPPTVLINGPTDNEVVEGLVSISATATDDKSVTQVEFFVDGNLLLTDSSSPYTASWDSTSVSDGFYTLSAVAKDSAGQTSSSSIQVEVDNIDLPPEVLITNPADNSTVDGTVTITADASDDKGIQKVEFYIGGILVHTDTTSSYSYSWDTTGYENDVYTVEAVVTDTNGQTSNSSVTVTVNNVAPVLPEMYVESIDWSSNFRRSRLRLRPRVNINWDSDGSGTATSNDNAASGVRVVLQLIHDTDGNNLFEATGGNDTVWELVATTNSQGRASFNLNRASVGNYHAEVISLEHVDYYWDGGLDLENPDRYDTISDSEPVFFSQIVPNAVVLVEELEEEPVILEENVETEKEFPNEEECLFPNMEPLPKRIRNEDVDSLFADLLNLWD